MSTDVTTHPSYCARQARKTPVIPWHNGFPTCVACRQNLRINDAGQVTARASEPDESAEYRGPGCDGTCGC